jgi:hypothetical protein
MVHHASCTTCGLHQRCVLCSVVQPGSMHALLQAGLGFLQEKQVVFQFTHSRLPMLDNVVHQNTLNTMLVG